VHKVVPKGEVDAPKQDADGQDEGCKGEEHTATQLQQLSGTWYQALNQQQRQQDIQRNLASVTHTSVDLQQEGWLRGCVR
jgi:hypothetical protein